MHSLFPTQLHIAANVIFWCSGIINPVIYIFANRHYRQTFAYYLKNGCCPREDRERPLDDTTASAAAESPFPRSLRSLWSRVSMSSRESRREEKRRRLSEGGGRGLHAAAIFDAPQDPYTRALMAAAFDLVADDAAVAV